MDRACSQLRPVRIWASTNKIWPNSLKTSNALLFVSFLQPSTPIYKVLEFIETTYARGIIPSFFESPYDLCSINANLMLPHDFKNPPLPRGGGLENATSSGD